MLGAASTKQRALSLLTCCVALAALSCAEQARFRLPQGLGDGFGLLIIEDATLPRPALHGAPLSELAYRVDTAFAAPRFTLLAYAEDGATLQLPEGAIALVEGGRPFPAWSTA